MPATPLSQPVDPSTAAADLPLVPWDRVERFVGQLTHDIRNGLNALELQLTFLGEISTDPEAVEEIKRVRATVGNVTRQLQTLRTATGTIKPYPLPYPAAEFFDDLRERLAKQHPGSGDKIVWEIALGAEAMLEVDPELTLNALLELLANALVFTNVEDLPIRVEVAAAGDVTTFALHERHGVRPEVSLEEWGRAPLLTTRRGAYGLGLFRVRRSLQVQDGGLDVDYSEQTRLLTTRVTLPAASPA